jgi:hypothetical protein
MKKFNLIFFLLFSASLFCQQKEKSTYVSLATFKKLSNKNLTKKDSLNFKIINGDTLVFVKNLNRLIRKTGKKNNATFSSRKRTYIDIEGFRKRYPNKKITKNILKIRGNDSIILIDNNDAFDRKNMVSVPYEVKDSSFLEVYKDIVYRKHQSSIENLREKGKPSYMKLWKKPIKIFFSKNIDNYYKNIIIKTAKKISKEVDSLSISIVNNSKESNYIIYQIDDDDSQKYSSNIKNNKYIDYYIKWNKGRIYDAKLELNFSNYKKFKKREHAKYLLQNFYETLGRFYRTDKLPCKSIISKCRSKSKKITQIDLEILKYHYSYGICKFTDLKTFEESHKKAKEALKRGSKMMYSHKF